MGADMPAATAPSSRQLGSAAELPILPRSLAYMGVMADDLTTKGYARPCRLMTAAPRHRPCCAATMPTCA